MNDNNLATSLLVLIIIVPVITITKWQRSIPA
jgi:hypothetical protein